MCILGYSRNHSGYRCWNLITHKDVICANAIFFENKSYFSPSFTPAVSGVSHGAPLPTTKFPGTPDKSK